MHTVVETPSFLAAAADAGMTEAERTAVVDQVAAAPDDGDKIKETGGCRKLRVSGRGKGKSGGYRVITFYSGETMPVFLITVFGKGEKDNLSRAERNELAKLAKLITETYANPHQRERKMQ